MTTSTTAIQFRNGGVLINADTAKITVTRNDTGAAVVSAQDLIHPSTGNYQYTWTDPAADLIYTVVVTFTLDGEPYTDSDNSFPGTVSGGDSETALNNIDAAILARSSAPDVVETQIAGDRTKLDFDNAIKMANYIEARAAAAAGTAVRQFTCFKGRI